MNSIEIKDKSVQLEQRAKEIVELANKEERSVNEVEQNEINEIRSQLDNLKVQYDDLQSKIEATQTEQRKHCTHTIEQRKQRNNTNISNLNISNINTSTNMEKQSVVKEIRSAIQNGSKSFKLNAATTAYEASATNIEQRSTTTADTPIATEIQGILEPLYANSVLAKLGVRFYTGLPMGDVSVPVMGGGNVGWASEVGLASESQNTFTSVTLKPKRLTAYVDISKKLLAQDTYGVEAAIQRDIVNALNAKLEATIFGDEVKTDDKPAGIFAGKTLVKTTDFKSICDAEGKVEDANVYGDMKYLLSTGAKAAFRAMAKGTKSTQLVYEDSAVDGVPALVTSNVPSNELVYGDFSNLAVGSWGDVEVVVDEYTQAVTGCVRLVINAYFDAALLRDSAFYFGTVEA